MLRITGAVAATALFWPVARDLATADVSLRPGKPKFISRCPQTSSRARPGPRSRSSQLGRRPSWAEKQASTGTCAGRQSGRPRPRRRRSTSSPQWAAIPTPWRTAPGRYHHGSASFRTRPRARSALEAARRVDPSPTAAA